MSKFGAGVLLLAVGLGIGLWLGFNPKGHAAVEQSWERANESIVRIQSDVSLRANSGQQAPEGTAQNDKQQFPQASPLTPIMAVLDALWNATRNLWVGLLARADMAR